uniref:Uncharacterized protein n=1 Tax=Tanacetum cinerariifolium TaxID=118510 RepID=A0A699LDP7_TANCI|nr:hypothetical protein [Tanacetum cinerariifolium]
MVNTFVDYKTELVMEGSKKDKVTEDDGDNVTIDATTLSSKSSIIVDYKIYKEGKKNYFQIFRADGLAKVVSWKLFESCGVHCVTLQSIQIYMLVEKMYPLTQHTLNQMLSNVKLQVDYECEMAYELLRLVKKQIKEGYRAN